MIKSKDDDHVEVLLSHEFPELLNPDEEWRADLIGYKPRMSGWTLLDLQTAHMLCTVHDALSPENQEKLSGLKWPRQVDVGWKLVTPKTA